MKGNQLFIYYSLKNNSRTGHDEIEGRFVEHYFTQTGNIDLNSAVRKIAWSEKSIPFIRGSYEGNLSNNSHHYSMY